MLLQSATWTAIASITVVRSLAETCNSLSPVLPCSLIAGYARMSISLRSAVTATCIYCTSIVGPRLCAFPNNTPAESRMRPLKICEYDLGK
ncbi:hypothetical protein V1522DRAFT_188672 [Lipomyces starkeyi]